MWLTYRGRCHTSRLAARQNGESVAVGEGQGKKIPGKQTRDVISKQDLSWDAISRTAIHEEMCFFFLWKQTYVLSDTSGGADASRRPTRVNVRAVKAAL